MTGEGLARGTAGAGVSAQAPALPVHPTGPAALALPVSASADPSVNRASRTEEAVGSW